MSNNNRFAVLSLDQHESIQESRLPILQKKDKYKHYTPPVAKNNRNTMLCQNIINYGKCSYRAKCNFAHTLDEQIIERRQEAYDIVRSNTNLSHINLQKNYALFKSLLELTKLCNECNNNKCVGGYNCKQGACHKKFVICYRDLYNGNCHGCDNIHLSKRGLKPYYQIQVPVHVYEPIKPTIITSEFFADLEVKSDHDCDSSIYSLEDEPTGNIIFDECKQSIFD